MSHSTDRINTIYDLLTVVIKVGEFVQTGLPYLPDARSQEEMEAFLFLEEFILLVIEMRALVAKTGRK